MQDIKDTIFLRLRECVLISCMSLSAQVWTGSFFLCSCVFKHNWNNLKCNHFSELNNFTHVKWQVLTIIYQADYTFGLRRCRVYCWRIVSFHCLSNSFIIVPIPLRLFHAPISWWRWCTGSVGIQFSFRSVGHLRLIISRSANSCGRGLLGYEHMFDLKYISM